MATLSNEFQADTCLVRLRQDSIVIVPQCFWESMLGRKAYKEIPLERIQTVTSGNGFIRFVVLGDQQVTGGLEDIVRDENTVVFGIEAKANFGKLQKTLQTRIKEAAALHHASPRPILYHPPQPGSIAPTITARGTNGTIQILEDRVRISHNTGDKDIFIENVTAINFKLPMTGLGGSPGYIQIAFHGGHDTRPGKGAGYSDNAVLFSADQIARFVKVKVEIETRMNARARQGTEKASSSSAESSSSGLEDLEKLASLRDKGIITDDEFNQKKRQILGI